MHGHNGSPAKNIFLSYFIIAKWKEKGFDVEMKESMLLVDHVLGIDSNIATLTVRSSLIS